MRTKTLSLVAALGAAGMMALQAQVYSVNVVGYVNVEVPAGGLALLCNPLDAGSNTVADLFGDSLPDGTIIYKYNGSGFDTATYMFGSWTGGDMSLDPGVGFFIYNPLTDNSLQITFVGEVKQGTLEVPLQAGLNLVGSIVPQAGKVHTDLGLPVGEGDTVYLFTGKSYDGYTYMFGSWTPEEPQVDVAQGFWVVKVNAETWSREFSVE